MREHALRVLERGRRALPGLNRPRAWIVLGASFVAALGIAGLTTADLRNPPDLLLFLGRFHPMLVHFPIGLLLLAGIMEAVAALYRPLRVLRHSTGLVLFLGSVGAVLAMAAGFLLSLEGGYEPAAVQLHMWLGVAVAAGSVAATVLKLRSQRRRARWPGRAYAGVLAATAGALLLAGHAGGSLTHGAGYLTHYLPGPLRGLLGPSEARAAAGGIANIDSARVYQDLVMPVLEARCTSCHGEGKEKGGLRLDTPEGLLKGGDSGPAVVAGSPGESELLRRIVLAPGDDDAMPPDGAPPLDIGETELIRWWIVSGASLEHRVADIEQIPTAVATLFRRIAPPRTEEKRGVYVLQAPPADPAAVAALRKQGFGVQAVARDVPLLHVTAVNIRTGMGSADMAALLPVAQQVTWLDLGGTRVEDADVALLARMPNLTRLFLEDSRVGDEGLRHLAGLRHLEYLNLHGTRVTDAGLEHLSAMPGLRKVFLWRTGVTPRAAAKLEESRDGLDVVLGEGPAAGESAPAEPAGAP